MSNGSGKRVVSGIVSPEAAASAAAALREHFTRTKCGEGVSHCIRCNVMYLVGVVERVLATGSTEDES